MLTVYYSPHSQSVDNEAGRASGHADVPLTALGTQQAQQLGEAYQSQVATIDAVFCSDLQRATTTAQIMFSSRQITVTRDARLREFDYGTLTQHPRAEVEPSQHLTEPFPGGESVWMAVQRVEDFLRDVLRDYDGQTVVIIGHVATRYGIEYWTGSRSLDDIVCTPWEWRNIPIWHYEVDHLRPNYAES